MRANYVPQKLKLILGKWRHPTPWDSNDYLTEYVISYKDGKPVVTGKDVQDGEDFIVSDVSWDGHVLRFKTLMPSTGREGINEMWLLKKDVLKVKFTFTETEELQRVG